MSWVPSGSSPKCLIHPFSRSFSPASRHLSEDWTWQPGINTIPSESLRQLRHQPFAMLLPILLAKILFVAGTLAMPSAEIRSQNIKRISRREEFIRRQAASPFHSSNWAGAVITNKTANFQGVTGQFVVPTFTAVSGLRNAYISIWLAIDGLTCTTATIKAGVDIEINDFGTVSYLVWDEYLPGQYFTESTTFTAQVTRSGSLMNVGVLASVLGTPATVIENLTNGEGAVDSRNFTPSPALCGADAIWAVEVWETGDVRVPVTVEWQNPQAQTGDARFVSPGSGNVVNTVENGVALSSCSTTATSLTCSF
ncbi:concanavalin A-like lectin/glucanase domain-containing protein [Mycena galericulata]|nr:concanavalin A-like lectin/glucanase domain-containing protein [Mycena galericulata]